MTFFLFQNTLSFYGRIHLPLTDGPSIKCVIKKTFFAFHLNSYENWWICSYQCVLKLHQVSLNSNEKLFLMIHFTKDDSLRADEFGQKYISKHIISWIVFIITIWFHFSHIFVKVFTCYWNTPGRLCFIGFS